MAKAFGDERLNKVCEARELELLTGLGWQLQEVLQESERASLAHEEQPIQRDGHSYYQEKISLEREGVITVHRFLLRKSGGTAIAEANALSESLREQTAAAEKAKKEAEAGRAEAMQATERVERRLSDLQLTVERVRMDLSAANAAKQKMETDLAAIRKDIGEAAMRRILDTVAAAAG